MARKKTPRGRPPIADADKMRGNLNFNCPLELVERVIEYQREAGFRKRADACRRLVESALTAAGK